MLVLPGVDLPEQSVSSALLPVMMVTSSLMSSKNISMLLITERTRESFSLGRRRKPIPTRGILLREHSDPWREPTWIIIGINYLQNGSRELRGLTRLGGGQASSCTPRLGRAGNLSDKSSHGIYSNSFYRENNKTILSSNIDYNIYYYFPIIYI